MRSETFAIHHEEQGQATEARASSSSEILTAKIAIVDDEPLNVRMVRWQLGQLGYHCLLGLSDPTVAIEALEDFEPDVVLLDIVMPGLSGIELLGQMQAHSLLRNVPAIVLTASQDRATRLDALQLGVSDFLNKPVDEAELSTRLRNVIEARRYREHLRDAAVQLERAVRQRTRELEASRREVVLCLARAAEYRDDNTGKHVVRVGKYAATLARALGLPETFAEMIELAAQLHDVGKIGIPDSILHKPGRLTPEERSLMRQHADYGWRIVAPLTSSVLDLTEPGGEDTSPMLTMAARIAAGHHERWDGNGYPLGLSENAIPLEARITAVADVFDALSTARCYKAAVPLEECFRVVAEERGRHFDPDVADACLRSKAAFSMIYHTMAEPK